MKKLICFMTIVLFTGANLFAQRSTAFITNGFGKAIDENTFVAVFVLNNINNEATQKKFTDAFKSYPSVKDVKFTLETDKKAAYSVTMYKKQHLAALQKMFILAGIEDININGKVILTKDLMIYAEEIKKQKKSNQKR
jgi:hypothetical protein